jgi:hypothetical protein
MTTHLATMFRTEFCDPFSLTRKKTVISRMQATLTRGLVLPLILFGLLAAAPLAVAAEWTDHSGAICKNFRADDVTYIDYFYYGTRSLKNAATMIICPLTRNTVSTYGAHFRVSVNHLGTQTTSCTVASYSEQGQFPSKFNSGSWTGSGRNVIEINLYGAGNSDTYSNYSVFCTIPGNGNGILSSVNMYEYY